MRAGREAVSGGAWRAVRGNGVRKAFLHFLLLVAWAVPCHAVIVVEKGKTEPTPGILVGETETTIVLDVRSPDGRVERRSIPRTAIDEILVAVSRERLEKLRRDQPQAYRDYAEDLAEKRRDPEAHLTALRLFLIAAYLDPDRLGHSSVLGMISLARSPMEAKRLRALAYLLDPAHDRAVLELPAPQGRPPRSRSDGPPTGQASAGNKGATAPSTGKSSSEHASLLEAVRQLRRGKRKDAQQSLQKPGVKESISKHADLVSYNDLVLAAASTERDLASTTLAALVELELRIETGAASRPVGPERGKEHRWSSLVRGQPSTAIPAERPPNLSLEGIIEFDPRHCHFRNGRWEP